VLEAPRHGISPEAGGYGLLGYSVLVPVQDRLTDPDVRVGGVALSVAVERDGDLRGRAGRRPCRLVCGERGKRPGSARRSRQGSGQAHRPLLLPGRGGGPVVVVAVTRHRGGRESRPQGEGVQ
jgi:hypothetical protein